ncbi:hypothetical protein ACSQ67_026162 [Phaseolus vulgaris]
MNSSSRPRRSLPGMSPRPTSSGSQTPWPGLHVCILGWTSPKPGWRKGSWMGSWWMLTHDDFSCNYLQVR